MDIKTIFSSVNKLEDWTSYAGSTADGEGSHIENKEVDIDLRKAKPSEIRWQLEHTSAEVRTALRALPPIDENSSGPLGPGLNTSGQLGIIIRALQAGLAESDK